MSTSILEQVTRSESAERAELLAEYRSLLALDNSNDPADADRLREIARHLGYDLARLGADQAAVREFARLNSVAVDLAGDENSLAEANAAAEKHRATMEKKIVDLRGKQDELDAVTASASSRRMRSENARRELATLRAKHADLFEGLPDVDAQIRREKLEGLVAELPELRAKLSQAQSELESAEIALDEAGDKARRTPPGNVAKKDAITALAEARRARDELAARIADLHGQIHEAERARRRVSRHDGA